MMGKRLQLWRLPNFDLERLPSAEDVYLFRGVARDNPKDERLFALAEVRDLTPVRDDDGRVVALPELERMLVEALAAIRGFQAHRAAEPAPALEPRAALRLAGARARPRASSARSSSACAPATARARPRDADRPRSPARTRRRACATACCASRPRAGRGVVARGRRPARPSRCSRSTTAPGGSSRRAGAASLHPAELVQLLAPAHGDRGPARRASSSSTTSTTTGGSCPSTGRPATNPARHRRRLDPQLHRALPRGDAARGPARRPDARARLARRARVPADHRRARPRRGARRAARVVRALRRREDLDGQRHREHGLDRRGAAPDRRVHAGGRRDQRRRQRHQRRRAAVLERRGDDADAHPRHPGHDAGERDGADRQAGARLLGRRLGRGQLRHRRLRAHHGPERPGAVLGARPRARRAGILLRHYEHTYVAPGERFPRRARTADPLDRDVARRPHRAPRLRASRRSATSSPTRRTRAARSRSTSAR